MSRIQLQIYVSPGLAEVFVNLKTKEGLYKRRAATIDTGAQVSMLPIELMDDLEYRLSERGEVTIDQAGIAKQAFQATEAFIKVFFEDLTGAQTPEFEIRVWFAQT
ncbi:MAG TPA: hypothetical protein VJZ27_06920, partial [Aggregatilineales bacterium]|nr:hypothetical protein [Aggregatilineales bacterium]